jgi:hypothetical protein
MQQRAKGRHGDTYVRGCLLLVEQMPAPELGERCCSSRISCERAGLRLPGFGLARLEQRRLAGRSAEPRLEVDRESRSFIRHANEAGAVKSDDAPMGLRPCFDRGELRQHCLNANHATEQAGSITMDDIQVGGSLPAAISAGLRRRWADVVDLAGRATHPGLCALDLRW